MLRGETQTVVRVVLEWGVVVVGMQRVIVDEVVGRLVLLHLRRSRSVDV
jgi:hypothetical protein